MMPHTHAPNIRAILVRIDESIKDELMELAHNDERSMNAEIVYLIRQEIRRRKDVQK